MRFQTAKTRLKTEPDLYFKMHLAEKKRCFLIDLEKVPSNELTLWLVYYDEKAKAEKRERQNAQISAKLANKA